MKVLFVTYFFPPAGGAGPHRALKFAAHLPSLGVETHVVAPADPKWVYADAELEPPPDMRIRRARYVGPRTRRRAEEIYGTRGLRRLVRELGFVLPRVLLPDQHVLWNLTAVPAAARVARREHVDVVLTTSPPSSAHLAGALLKRLLGVRWVADLRDPMVGHQHRRVELRAVRAKERAEQVAARLVAREADAIVAASEGVARSMHAFSPAGRVRVIPNGCDFEDVAALEYRRGDRLLVTHTGMMLGRRTPRPFLSALAASDVDAVARFVGGFRAADRAWAERQGLGGLLEITGYVSHRRALELQRASDVLLLLIPEAEGRGDGVVSAKVFEYLAAERPILAAVPPTGEAAALLRQTDAAVVVAPDDIPALRNALTELASRWRDGGLSATPLAPPVRERLSRRARVSELAEVLRSVA